MHLMSAGCWFHGFDKDDETGGATLQASAAAFYNCSYVGLGACATAVDFSKDGEDKYGASEALIMNSKFTNNLPDACPSANCTIYTDIGDTLTAGRGIDDDRTSGMVPAATRSNDDCVAKSGVLAAGQHVSPAGDARSVQFCCTLVQSHTAQCVQTFTAALSAVRLRPQASS